MAPHWRWDFQSSKSDLGESRLHRAAPGGENPHLVQQNPTFPANQLQIYPKNPKGPGMTDEPELSTRAGLRSQIQIFLPCVQSNCQTNIQNVKRNPKIPWISVSQPVAGQSHPVVTPKSPKSNNQPNLAKFPPKAADLFKVFKII